MLESGLFFDRLLDVMIHDRLVRLGGRRTLLIHLLLVSDSVVNLVDSTFFEICSINCLGVIIRYPCSFGGLGNGEGFLVNESN